jgi:hypothetical protein
VRARLLFKKSHPVGVLPEIILGMWALLKHAVVWRMTCPAFISGDQDETQPATESQLDGAAMSLAKQKSGVDVSPVADPPVPGLFLVSVLWLWLLVRWPGA